MQCALGMGVQEARTKAGKMGGGHGPRGSCLLGLLLEVLVGHLILAELRMLKFEA